MHNSATELAKIPHRSDLLTCVRQICSPALTIGLLAFGGPSVSSTWQEADLALRLSLSNTTRHIIIIEASSRTTTRPPEAPREGYKVVPQICHRNWG